LKSIQSFQLFSLAFSSIQTSVIADLYNPSRTEKAGERR